MKISVITVTFNSVGTIGDTIKSVFEQEYGDYEYLVIDGGSTDGTMDVVREWEPRFSGRMRYVSEPDGGMYDAINKGIRMSEGDIVGILNSDDLFSNKNILKIIAEAFSDGSQAIYGDVRFVTPKDIHKTVRYYSSRLWRPWMFRFGFMPAHPTFYTYRSNFEKFGFYKDGYKIAADFELLVRFLYVNRLKTKYIPVEFVTMRMGGKSTSGWKSFWTLTKEDTRSCRINGIWTCAPLVMTRAIYKIVVVGCNRLKNRGKIAGN